jgi:hypothetical protein
MAGQTKSARSVMLALPGLRDHYPVDVCSINHLKFFWKSRGNHLYHQRYHQFMIFNILEQGGHPNIVPVKRENEKNSSFGTPFWDVVENLLFKKTD